MSAQLSRAEFAVGRRVADVVKSDATTRQFAEAFLIAERKLVEMRQAVLFLGSQYLPADLKYTGLERLFENLDGTVEWRRAIAAMSRDADTPLPGEGLRSRASGTTQGRIREWCSGRVPFTQGSSGRRTTFLSHVGIFVPRNPRIVWTLLTAQSNFDRGTGHDWQRHRPC
jgi:hypothetical protein